MASDYAHTSSTMSDTTLDPTDQTELLRSLALERISPQWADFLGLMSEALGAQL